jgi:predicted amidohydrolase
MKIAVVQTEATRLADWRATQDTLVDQVAEAARQAADLVLFPEGAWPAYHIGSLERWRAARADGMPDGSVFLASMQQAAREHALMICVGYLREDRDRLANVASLIARNGDVLTTHQKTFLWDFDNDWFVPGVDLQPAETPFGPVGAMICADARVPEVSATLTDRGTGLILQPTAWVNGGTADAPWNPQPDFLIRARALEFGVPVASATKWGVEGDTLFVGQSLICDAYGSVLAQAGMEESRTLVAEVTPQKPAKIALREPQRAILQSDAPPVPPSAAAPPLHLALFPSDTPAADVAEAVRVRLQTLDGNARLLVATLEPLADELASADRVSVVGPVSSELRVGEAEVRVLTADDCVSFVAARCAALRGAHVLVVFGDLAEPLARARAMENRLFVAVVGAKETRLYGPSSFPIDPSLPIETAEAANKYVTRATDVLRGRNPAIYAF